jgi:hypothetical protein
VGDDLYPTYSQNAQTGNKYYNINNPGSYTIHGVPLHIEIEHPYHLPFHCLYPCAKPQR